MKGSVVCDFGQELAGHDRTYLAYGPRRPADPVTIVANRLQIAVDDGRPQISLTAVRGTHPFLPPEPHGRLDLSLEPPPIEDLCLHASRTRWPRSGLTDARFTNGFLRISFGDPDTGDPTLVAAPERMQFNGFHRNRISLRLSPSRTSLLAQALEDDVLLFEAAAEVVLPGWSASAAARVSFDPAALIAHLDRSGDPPGVFSIPALADALRRAGDDLIEWLPPTSKGQTRSDSGADAGSETAVRSLIDHLAARYGQWIPAPATAAEPTIQFPPPASIAPGRFIWDLSSPVPTSRVFVLGFSPLDEARRLVADEGIEKVFTTRIVPGLRTGVVHVEVASNLPPRADGVHHWGAHFRAAPSQHRAEAINETVLVSQSSPYDEVLLRFSPAEPPTYQVTPFVILDTTDGPLQLTGQPYRTTGSKVELWPDAFPIVTIPLSLSGPLAAAARLELTVSVPSSPETGQDLETIDVRLDTDNLVTTVVLPASISQAEIKATAFDRNDDGRQVTLPARSVDGWRLGLFSFPNYGPQSVTFTCRFGAISDDPVHLEVRPRTQEQGGGPDEPALVELSPTQPSRSWSWFGRSIFDSGFSYRILGQDSWIDVVAAVTVVEIERPEPGSHIPLLPGDEQFEHLVYNRRAAVGSGAAFSFLTTRVRPTVDPAGRPMLQLILAGEVAFLQLSATLQPETDQLERLRLFIEDRHPDLGHVRLAAAEISTTSATLVVVSARQESTTLAEIEPGSWPNHNALFNVTVDELAQDAVIASLGGDLGRTFISYEIERSWTLALTSAIGGDIVPAELPATGGEVTLVSWIETAIKDGVLHYHLSDNASSMDDEDVMAARATHRRSTIDEATAALEAIRRRGGEQAQHFFVSLDTDKPLVRSYRLRADLASWFPDGRGIDHVVVTAT